MKLLLLLTTMLIVSSCNSYKTEGERISFKDKEVKLTILHTTDVHSKILPFQFTPNSWDRKVGLAPQDPQGHCNCDNEFQKEDGTSYYPLGESCIERDNTVEHNCMVDSDCPSVKHCYAKNHVCYTCYEDSHCKSNQKCVNYECKNKDTGSRSCTSNSGNEQISCGAHGSCYDDNGTQFYGGFARLGYLLEIEKSLVKRSVYIDSGDLYQGAPIFNFFQGEPEVRAMNILRPDAQTLGNHEFDQGVTNWVENIATWTTYPILAANYDFLNPDLPQNNSLPKVVAPYTIVERDGLKIGIVGLANTSTIISIKNAGNSMGIKPETPEVAAQYYIDLIKNDVDLIIVDSHEGLNVDQHLCQVLKDADVILGGHHHVLTDPPQEIINTTTGGKCILLHSGVNAKFLTVMNLVLKDIKQGDGFSGLEVINVNLKVDKIDNRVDESIEAAKLQIELADNGLSTLPKEKIAVKRRAVKRFAEITHMLENYEDAMYQILDVDLVIGKAETLINRIDVNGANSPLGNLVADAMLKREFVDADFSITNSLGIRADLPKGNIKISKIFEIFPFNNTIMTMTLSGKEVQEMLDYAASRSAERGCISQVQVAGMKATFNCAKSVAEDVVIAGSPLNPYGFYEVSTNDYMGRGGSGFDMLARVTTKTDTGIELRNAVINYIRQKQPIKMSDFNDSRLKMKR